LQFSLASEPDLHGKIIFSPYKIVHLSARDAMGAFLRKGGMSEVLLATEKR